MGQLTGFLGDPTHFQLALFCWVMALMMIGLDVRNLFRNMRPRFMFDALLAFVVGAAQLYFAVTAGG